MTSSPSSAAPGYLRRDVRPPIEMDAAPSPGAAAPLRRTARRRRTIRPRAWPLEQAGFSLDDPYVRRYRTALIGPGAVADLLRIATAAARGRSLPRPVHLDTLARHQLVTAEGEELLVRTSIPPLNPSQVRRLHPMLRNELTRGAGAPSALP